MTGRSQDRLRQALVTVPDAVGRIGRPGDVAHLVVALALSQFTTGVVIPVDGGAHLAPER